LDLKAEIESSVSQLSYKRLFQAVSTWVSWGQLHHLTTVPPLTGDAAGYTDSTLTVCRYVYISSAAVKSTWLAAMSTGTRPGACAGVRQMI